MKASALDMTASAADREVFGAYLCDNESIEALAPIALERDWQPDRIQSGGIAMAVRTLAISSSPHLLIVDISDSADPLSDMNELAEVCEPGTAVLAIGSTNDVGLYRDLLASGVQDYLVKPVSTEMLRNAILAVEYALKAQSDGAAAAIEVKGARVVAFIGARGGVGASTLATNAAWIIANNFRKRVALADLDMYFGTTALSFDLEPGRGLYDALENPSRVDGLFIERAMVKQGERLSILGAEAPLTESVNPDPVALQHLMSELRKSFQTVVLDFPRFLAAQHGWLLADAAEIVVVSELTLAGIRDTIRMLSFLKTMAPEAKLRIAVNRIPKADLCEVTLKDFESSIERKADWAIPDDAHALVAAGKAAKPLAQAASGSKIVAALTDLAKQTANIKMIEKKQGVWTNLMQKVSVKKGA